ncbi:hypothetical protein VKT23_019737 [Stygiomarasmius scandens]|uniref:Ribonuclease H1 N-terminal domain-containing protein n=1 Tax=Marasmiellus scandens TaxID=2682957 RepID=A0ABR1IPJ7_9AGAR
MSSSYHEESESSLSTTNSDSSSDDLWATLEDLGPYMAQVPSHPCCQPQLYDSRSPGVAFKPKKWYLVFTGTGAGCYTTWADASGRVVGIKGARHESYNTLEKALHGWRQNCISHHNHPHDFVDGSIFVPPTPTRLCAITPPPDDHTEFDHVRQTATPPASPTQVAAASLPSTPSRHRVARAFFGSGSPRQQAAPNPPPRRWAILANGVTGVFDAESGDAVLEEARLRSVPVQAREVESLMEATEWLERMELSTDADSE